MPTINNSKQRREQRKKRAEDRQKERDARTPKQQIKRLNTLLGNGKGAKKERERLNGK